MNNFIFKKNRKGALPIFVFVILTFVVCSFTLFIFLNNPPKVQATLKGVGNFDEIYLSELDLEFYLQEVAELSLAQTYNEFVSSGNYISNLRISKAESLEEIYYIGGISNNFEKDFRDNFKNNFKENFLKINFNMDDSDSLKELQKQVEKENFEVLFDKNLISVLIKEFNFSYKDNKMQINYTSDLRSHINFNRFGLEDFENIVKFGNLCTSYKNISEKFECYNKNEDYFDNFYLEFKEIFITDNHNELVIIFETKKEFYFEEDFQKISFSFISN